MKQQLLQRKGAERKGTKEAVCLEGGMPSAQRDGKTLILVSKPLPNRDIIFPCQSQKEPLAIGAVHNYFDAYTLHFLPP